MPSRKGKNIKSICKFWYIEAETENFWFCAYNNYIGFKIKFRLCTPPQIVKIVLLNSILITYC